MKIKMFSLVALLVVSTTLLQLSCATTVGYFIGHSIDQSKPDSLYLPAEKAEEVKQGTEINLLLTDESRITGIYRGLRKATYEEFIENKIPLYNTILVEKSDQTMQFPIDKVNKIELKNKKNARWIGLGFGAVIDVSIIVAVIALEVKSSLDFGQ